MKGLKHILKRTMRPSFVSMLGQRLRRWPNIETTLLFNIIHHRHCIQTPHILAVKLI